MVRLSLGERRRSEQGAVAIVTAMVAMVLFVVAALVVDLGLARDARRQSQNAADSASLAAANVLYGNGVKPDFAVAVAAAKAYSAKNFGITAADWSACTDAAALRYKPGGTPCISFQNAASSVLDVSKPDTIRVRVPVRELGSTFGGAAGVSKIPIRAESEASLNTLTLPPCALCVLGTGNHDLQNGDITVSGGNVNFNGSVSLNPNAVLTSDQPITVQGNLTGAATVNPPALTGQAAMADPLAFVKMPEELPVYSTLSVKTNPCSSGASGGPGLYGSYSFSGSDCTLQPGLYVIGGDGSPGSQWSVNGNVKVTGVGVTLYFRCGTGSMPAACQSSGSAGAWLSSSGGGVWDLTAPDSGDLKGMVLLYGRNNTSLIELKGNTAGKVSGTVYAQRATLSIGGNGCGSAIRSQIVVFDLKMNGNPACMKSHLCACGQRGPAARGAPPHPVVRNRYRLGERQLLDGRPGLGVRLRQRLGGVDRLPGQARRVDTDDRVLARDGADGGADLVAEVPARHQLGGGLERRVCGLRRQMEQADALPVADQRRQLASHPDQPSPAKVHLGLLLFLAGRRIEGDRAAVRSQEPGQQVVREDRVAVDQDQVLASGGR